MKLQYKTYKPMVGDHISDAAKKAISIAKQNNCEVFFKFNDLEIVANKNNTVESVCAQYSEKSDKRSAEYRKSPEYKERERLGEIQRRENQKKVDNLMLELSSLQKDSEILEWLYEFIPLADNIHIQADRQIVKDYLVALGYEESWGLDQPEEFYKNKSNFARYIIGQIMNCWHPALTKFIDDWRKLT